MNHGTTEHYIGKKFVIFMFLKNTKYGIYKLWIA